MKTNLDHFMRIYEEILRDNIKNFPANYPWATSEEKTADFISKMRGKILSGEFLIESPTIVATCNALNIRRTYESISDFINQHNI